MDNDDHAIVLSDCSDELNTSEKDVLQRNRRENVKRKASNESDISLSDFPIVDLKEINGIPNKSKKDAKEKKCHDLERSDVNIELNNFRTESEQEKEESDSKNSEAFERKNNSKNKDVRKESQSDSDYETQNFPHDYFDQYMKGLKAKYQADVDLSSDENEEVSEKEENINKKKGRKREPKSKKIDEEKKKRQEEREQQKIRKQEEAARQKALKQLNSRNRLNTNPEYSIKLMEIIFDEEILNYDFFAEFLKAAQESEVKYKMQSQLVPKSITWNRRVEENYVNEKHEICSNTSIIGENQIIIIWDSEETVKHINEDTLVAAISNIKSLMPDKKLSLVIYKIESYFKFIKNLKDRAMQDEILNGLGHEKQKKSKTKTDKMFSNFPKISRKKFDECLIEIQLMHNVSSRLIENPAEMVLLIHQYTKSLALMPSKMEKRQEASKIDWYVNCDNRDTVKVDKDGNGLKRLWQQQLCQFTLMSLETSEAISSVYKSPLQLIEAYARCTPAEGEILLKDIPIRRAAGPLTSVRKIGPELSKKLYVMFTSKDGEVYLND